MVHLFGFSHAVERLDALAHPSVIDRALRHAGLTREAIMAGPGFVPYQAEAAVVEFVARAMGERHLGALAGAAFDYGAFQGYSDYVFGAPNLAVALARGRRALPFIHPGSAVLIDRSAEFLLLGFETGLHTVLGNRHLEEGALFVMSSLCRHFLGADWCPAWIEIGRDPQTDTGPMEEIAGTAIWTAGERTALAIRLSDLAAPNLHPQLPENIVTWHDLPALMGVAQPKKLEDVLLETLRVQFRLGDISEDSVAQRLFMGPRRLQRALQQEGTSFREVRARFIEERARSLLAETDLSVEAVGRSLGYKEPKSFRRAFKSWTGVSPATFRKSANE